ncbi:MAG: ParA family protein, partial [Elusimicrobia bacterium]|nr:ParA family protein [Elusimicrobiota bacterium]
TINKVKQTLNTELNILGIVFTMFDARLQLGKAVMKEVKDHFPGRLFDTVIPRSVRLAEAPSFSLPIHAYAPESSGTHAYTSLANEFLARMSNNIPNKLQTAGVGGGNGS